MTAATLALTDTGTVTQSQAISVTNLDLLGSGATYTLTGPTTGSNSVGTLAANTGSVSLTDATALTIGTVSSNGVATNGVTTSGALTLNVSGSGGSCSGGSGCISDPAYNVSVGSFILNGGNWLQTGTLASFADSGDFELNNGATFLRASGGAGTSGSPYQITDVYGLQGMAGFLGSSFVLANNINASSTSTWNPQGGGVYAGFMPIGSLTSYFTGTFNGNGSHRGLDFPGSSAKNRVPAVDLV